MYAFFFVLRAKEKINRTSFFFFFFFFLFFIIFVNFLKKS